MTTSKWRGNDIEYVNDVWVYSDTKQLVSENKDRKCGECNKQNTEDGHDGCLGELPDIMNACCGHGLRKEAYVQMLDGSCLRGDEAVIYINYLKEKR